MSRGNHTPRTPEQIEHLRRIGRKFMTDPVTREKYEMFVCVAWTPEMDAVWRDAVTDQSFSTRLAADKIGVAYGTLRKRMRACGARRVVRWEIAQ